MTTLPPVDDSAEMNNRLPERCRFFLFKHKTDSLETLAYGTSPEDARATLALRLSKKEMARIDWETFEVLKHQREIPALVAAGRLG